MRNKGFNLIAAIILFAVVALIISKVISIGVKIPETGDPEDSKADSAVSTDTSAYYSTADKLIAAEDYNGKSFTSSVVIIEADDRMATRGSAVKGPTGATNLMMVALIAAQSSDANSTFVVKDELSLIPEGANLCGLRAGDILTLPMMLDALLLGKGADAAYVAAVNIARDLSGNENMDTENAVKSFIALMNSTAAQISMSNTKYTNLYGENDDSQYTTADDILKLTEKCRDYDSIRTSVAKKSATHRTNNGREISFTNNNRLLDNGSSGYYYDAADGFMVWKLSDGSCCAVATAVFDEKEVIAVFLGATDERSIYLDIHDAFYPMLSQSVLNGGSVSAEASSAENN